MYIVYSNILEYIYTNNKYIIQREYKYTSLPIINLAGISQYTLGATVIIIPPMKNIHVSINIAPRRPHSFAKCPPVHRCG